MSFLHDTFLPGARGVHLGGSTTTTSEAVTADRRKQQLRKSQSHGSFLNPLLRLTRNPRGVISDIFSDWQGDRADRLDANDESRRQVLYMRMNNVRDSLRRHRRH
jgi:TAG lipase / steryl ester hydrolase / phospholipase A2 / LPA acyltransferase